MTVVLVALFVVGLVQGLVGVGTVAAFRGRPTVTPDGRRGRRRGPLRIGLGLLGLGVVASLLVVELGWFYANRQFDRIDRVEVDVDGRSALAGSSGGTNFLLVGTDRREGFEQNLADTIMVLRTGDGPPRMMSIPRDLLVPVPTRDGQEGRINSAYNDGPVGLIRAVQESVGIPLDRYVEVGFDTFVGLVDAIGGVTIHFDHPAFDEGSGLNVERSGPVVLDGEQALAYVRSRFYQEVIDGEVQPPDGLADLSRIQRQQTFLETVLAESASSRNPFELNRIGGALVDGLRIDEHMRLVDALVFVWALGRGSPERVELPVAFIPGSGAVSLSQPDAEGVIADFRS